MALFTSTYVNRIDKKGRVSVPAAFRSVLDGQQGGAAIYLKPNHGLGAIDGHGEAFMEQIMERIDALPLGSEERIAQETVYFGETTRIQFDPEGRIGLPKELMEQAGIGEQAVFVGLGRYFQIWEPQAFQAHRARQAEIAKAHVLAKPGAPGRAG